MQFGIAARKPAQVAVLRRRLVGERREGDDLGPGRPPAFHEMRVDERERRVARERDALPRRPKRGGRRRRRSAIEFAGQRENAAAIDIRLDEIGDRLEPRLERLRLARLHKAQMALGQRDLLVARQRANDRDAHRLDRLDNEPAMALAADAIDDDASDFEPPVIRLRSP